MGHKHFYSMGFRWTALLAIVLNIVFSVFYTGILKTSSIAEVAASYPGYFSMSSYAFTIWVLIHTAFIVYGIIQVLPSGRNNTIYGTLSIPVVLVNVLNILWIVAFTSHLLAIGVCVLALMLLITGGMFINTSRAVVQHNHNLWLQFPFCVLASWLTAALMINASMYLKSAGWLPESAEAVTAIVMIVSVTITGLVVSRRTSSLVFPAVIAWALIAVNSAHGNDAPGIAGAAFSCALLLLILPVLTAIFKKESSRSRIRPSH